MWNYGLFFLALLSMIFALGGVTWFFEGFAFLRRKRMIEDLPTSKIRNISLGLVEVKGKAKWKEELYGPISGTPCVYYTYKVEQKQRRHGNSNWSAIALGDSGENHFYLEDDTGRILVDPLNAELSSPVSDTLRFPDYHNLPQNLKSLIDNESNLILRRIRSSGGELMFTENCLKTDHEIYVLGTVGYQDDESWGKEDRMIIKKGKEIPFLYISNRAEKEITRRMIRSFIKRLIGGPMTLGVCCFLLYLYYDVSLRYIDRSIEISLLFKGWILFGPILAVIIVFFLGYRYYDFTKVLIRSQGS